MEACINKSLGAPSLPKPLLWFNFENFFCLPTAYSLPFGNELLSPKEFLGLASICLSASLQQADVWGFSAGTSTLMLRLKGHSFKGFTRGGSFFHSFVQSTNTYRELIPSQPW